MTDKPLGRIGLTLCALLNYAGALAGESALISGERENAPEGLRQYGQFVGTWRCEPAYRDAEGIWQQSPARPTWIWHWVLNGAAVQDVWIPDPENAPPGAVMGTNLRVYDAESNQWEMVWTTENLGGFQRFTAKTAEGNIVMHGDVPAGPRPAHLARITFHGITADHFDWKYEASPPGDGENWQLFSTLSCTRQAD